MKYKHIEKFLQIDSEQLDRDEIFLTDAAGNQFVRDIIFLCRKLKEGQSASIHRIDRHDTYKHANWRALHEKHNKLCLALKMLIIKTELSSEPGVEGTLTVSDELLDDLRFILFEYR